MKRCCMLLLGACPWLLAVSGEAAAQQVLRAGAAQVDITPTQWPVRVSGGFLEGTATEAHDTLRARALVLDDGQEQVALVIVDNLMMPRAMLDEVKQTVQEQIGLPTDRILIAATHTHSAPAAMGALGTRADPAYCQFLPGRLVEAIVAAHGNLAPARIGWAVVRDYAHNHCRRWIFRPDCMIEDPFGQTSVRAMMHPGHESPLHVGPAGPVDPALTLLCVQTLSGQPVAVLANYAMHYKGAGPVSGDFCGKFGDALGARLGVGGEGSTLVGMMSQGTSGDSMWMDYARPANDPGLDGYTQAMVDRVQEAYGTITYHTWVPIAMAETRLRLARRAPDDVRLAWARRLAEEMDGRRPQNIPEVYALEAISLHDEPEVELKLQALRIGDLGVTAIPAEVYGITGLKIKQQSPTPVTCNIELANGAEGYIPPPEQHVLGGYTTWPARTAGLEVAAEPRIVEAVLQLLEQVAQAPRTLRELPGDGYVDAVQQAQPHAYWRLDELAGTVARDATGNGHDGVFEPGVAFYLPGRDTVSREFAEQAPTRGVQCAGGRLVTKVGELGEAWTIELWCCNGLPADARPVVGHLCARLVDAQSPPAVDQLSLVATPAGQAVLSYGEGSPVGGRGTTPLELRRWHHVVLVRDGSQVRIYLDGRVEPEITVEAGPSSDAPSQLVFGGTHDHLSTWEGKLDDIAVYRRALAPAEIAAHYAAADAERGSGK